MLFVVQRKEVTSSKLHSSEEMILPRLCLDWISDENIAKKLVENYSNNVLGKHFKKKLKSLEKSYY